MAADDQFYFLGRPFKPQLRLWYDNEHLGDEDENGLVFSLNLQSLMSEPAKNFDYYQIDFHMSLKTADSSVFCRDGHYTASALCDGARLYHTAHDALLSPKHLKDMDSITFQCVFCVPGKRWVDDAPFSDVVIEQAEEKKEFSAHAWVLAAESPVLARTALRGTAPFKLIWNAISSPGIECLLRAIYVQYFDWRELDKLGLDEICKLYAFIHPLELLRLCELLNLYLLNVEIIEKTVEQLQGLASLYDIEPLRKRLLQKMMEDRGLFGKFAFVSRKRGRDGDATAAAEEPKAKEAKS